CGTADSQLTYRSFGHCVWILHTWLFLKDLMKYLHVLGKAGTALASWFTSDLNSLHSITSNSWIVSAFTVIQPGVWQH
ncbi:MAG: hypothetical protein MUO51_11270, partial [Woeseiaceae bacterium]|nr:hypothetical protein [Woeseiaceae bacterium]